MDVLKKCHHCMEYYLGQLMNPMAYCPKPDCQKVWKRVLVSIIHQRYHLMEDLDVWSPTLKDDYGFPRRVCRICGGLLRYTKKGRVSQSRYCDECRAKEGDGLFRKIFAMFEWNEARAAFMRQKRIAWDGKDVYECEGCHEFFPASKVDVHHIKPVHTLDETNYRLTWDPSNFTIRCAKCHGIAHRKAEKISPSELYKQQMRKVHLSLDRFLPSTQVLKEIKKEEASR